MINSNSLNFAWVDKYQPQTVDDLIATEELKQRIQKIVESGNLPNLLLVGPSGVGKTTIAYLLARLFEADVLFINSSLNGNIDTLRNDISSFASAMSLTDQRRMAILDEADYLSHATQPALRSFIDTHSKNCSFVLTANYKNKIIKPLQSRLKVIEFKLNKEQRLELSKQFYERAKEILALENIKFDPQALAKFVVDNAPDWRNILIELQDYAQTHGEIDTGILVTKSTNFDQLIQAVKSKDFDKVRSYIGHNNVDETFYTDFYNAFIPHVAEISLPDLTILIARYQYQAAFVADQQVNAAACLGEVMVECQML